MRHNIISIESRDARGVKGLKNMKLSRSLSTVSSDISLIWKYVLVVTDSMHDILLLKVEHT